VKTVQDYEPFFYPLDAVLHWNRGYGKRGWCSSSTRSRGSTRRRGTIEILREIAKSGLASFLRVLKAFGENSFAGDDELSPGRHHAGAGTFPINPI